MCLTGVGSVLVNSWEKFELNCSPNHVKKWNAEKRDMSSSHCKKNLFCAKNPGSDCQTWLNELSRQTRSHGMKSNIMFLNMF